MKTLATASAVLVLAAGAAGAQTLDDLKNDGRSNDATNSDNILTYGMGYHQQRYSPLKQIDTQDRQAAGAGMEPEPRQQLGRAGAADRLQRRDVRDQRAPHGGDRRRDRQADLEAHRSTGRPRRRASCAAASPTRARRSTTAGFIAPRSTRTWSRSTPRPARRSGSRRSAEWKDGYSLTLAPLIANGVLITGISGAEFGIRGFIDGWDPETGKQLWRRYTIPARGEKGNETWPQDSNAWEIGGGSSLDHRLLRSRARPRCTGAPAIRRRGPRRARPGDNLYTSSVLALRPKTGEIVWHYQFTPNDAYDYDACWELILADIEVAGAKRKVLDAAQPQWLPLCARPHQRQADLRPSRSRRSNWASHIDMETGRPVETEIAKKIRAGEQIELWPSTRGGKNWPHAAFNPKTGLLYANTMHAGGCSSTFETKPYVVGQRYHVRREPADAAHARASRSAISTPSIR